MDGEQTTPDAGTSGQEGGTPFDYKHAYENELRPEYTRTTQELSQVKQSLSEYEQLFNALHDSDPEVQAAAFEALGLELDTGSQQQLPAAPDDFVDPLEEELKALRGQVDELRTAASAEATAREQRRMEDMRDDYIGEAIGFIEEQRSQGAPEKFRFTEREEEALGNLAISMTGEDGVPNVQGAYELLYGTEGVLETNRARWIDTKQGAFAPPAGTSIPADQKPQNRRERIAYIDKRVADIERQQ